MPLYRRLPKRGFKPFNKKNIAIINLSDLERLIERKKIKPTDELSLKYFKDKKIIKRDLSYLKILGGGEIKNKLKLNIDFVSNSAKSKIEKAGGTINILNKKNK